MKYFRMIAFDCRANFYAKPAFNTFIFDQSRKNETFFVFYHLYAVSRTDLFTCATSVTTIFIELGKYIGKIMIHFGDLSINFNFRKIRLRIVFFLQYRLTKIDSGSESSS